MICFLTSGMVVSVCWEILYAILMTRTTDSTRRSLVRKNDSDAFKIMMDAYIDKPASQGYRKTVASRCRAILDQIVKPSQTVAYVVALDERPLIWDLLVDQIEKSVLRREDRLAE